METTQLLVGRVHKHQVMMSWEEILRVWHCRMFIHITAFAEHTQLQRFSNTPSGVLTFCRPPWPMSRTGPKLMELPDSRYP